MSFGTKLFGTGASSSAAEKGRGDSLAAAGMLRVACPACGHESEIPRATPAFGTAVICSRCKASLIRVSDPNERPYSPPREVALFLGYHGCSLLHAHCPWCRKVNYSVVVPERGYSVSFYWNRQQENPNAAFVVNANCAHCGQPYVIEWDEDPRCQVPLVYKRV